MISILYDNTPRVGQTWQLKYYRGTNYYKIKIIDISHTHIQYKYEEDIQSNIDLTISDYIEDFTRDFKRI
jgi:outer membrane receptor for Fe3+-dicitrate